MWSSHMTGRRHGRRAARECRAVLVDGSASATAAPAAAVDDTAVPSTAPDDYARGARVLSVGIASTGLFTFLYFAVASHVLPSSAYGALSLLWSVLFVVVT